MRNLVTGNVSSIADNHRGWITGWFVDEVPELKNNHFEIKWAEHKAGDTKSFSGTNETAKSLCILISGKVKLNFESEAKEITLEKKGDYVYWDAGTSHSWVFLTDGMTFVIRWPSIPNDQKTS